MGIRILSDLHCEFGDFILPELDTDKEDVLVLAGDIGVVETPSSFNRVKEWATAKRFKKIIHICGNHEFYGGSLLRVPTKLKEMFKGLDISVAVNNEVIRVDDISFVCATLWTNFNSGNPVIMNIVQGALNDYRAIRTGNYGEPYKRKLTAKDVFSEFVTSKHFIFKSIEEEKYIDGQKIVVMSHHGPSRQSIHAQYDGDPVNWGYVSELDLEIMDSGADLYIHGHTHHSFDYPVGDTRVITNPRGYVSRFVDRRTGEVELVPENQDFNPTLRIVL